MKDVPVDLHILVDSTDPLNVKATGSLLIEGDTNEALDYCFKTFTGLGKIITVTDSAAAMGGS